MGSIVITRNYTIEIVRPALLPPLPGSAEPRREFTRVFTTRANVKSMGGKSEFSRVDIGGKLVTHKFSIRYTTIPFDVRDMVRDARGALYSILKIDDVDLRNREFVLMCASQGSEEMAGAR